ncbi:MAG TPA: bifunctional precorrin-2 dehydrogenase/sirohydrochlorin ferrochelatase [Candidatus Sulfotelmatobacter sp.]|nr:bifunctional precorrin-2 dehydrogenase/sirohydrochlorin ferrochelatase [Candidatus Sulfotelmatobacter sp.]
MPRFYPMMVDLTGKPVVVVGGGTIALDKVELFLKFDAAVTVVSPDLHPDLQALLAAGSIRHVPRVYRRGDLEGAGVAVAATDDRATNSRVAADARAAGTPVNVVDTPRECTFIVPSVVVRDDLVIAISTGGASPALAKRVRRDLEARYGPAYGELVELLRQTRDRLMREGAAFADRQGFFECALAGDTLDLVDRGDLAAVKARFDGMVAHYLSNRPAPAATP